MDDLSSLVNWSRAQFALTTIYHWFFVPLTLGLSFIIAFLHTIYYKTGDTKWKTLTKFWMKLFAINFAIGVATGIILEFEFGTNWSNYSWFVGDIFGAPLAIEGILAFFMESVFIAVMFFGWDRVSKKMHMLSSWFVAVGSNLSALWILVANAWMQNPVGTTFNPDTVRNEMTNFWDVLFSSTAVHKFLHTISEAYLVSCLFVVGISAFYLLKKRHIMFAKRSILVASIFGFLSACFVGLTGDGSAYSVAQEQPMKLAAMEGLYKGEVNAGIIAGGVLTPGKKVNDDKPEFIASVKIPYALGLLANRKLDAFTPGIEDLVNGNEEHGIISTKEKIAQGKLSIQALAEYKNIIKRAGVHKYSDLQEGTILKNSADAQLKIFNDNYKYFGYGYLDKPEDIVPNVPLTFYAFHVMVILGTLFIALFPVLLFFLWRGTLEKQKLLLIGTVLTVPLGYIASEAGWIVAECGRQPWIIQNLMPTGIGTSHISTGSVQITFFLFLILFTLLLIADIGILINQIKKGPDELEGGNE